MPVPNKGNFIWIGLIVTNGTPITFEIMDRMNNVAIFRSTQKREFVAKLFFMKPENVKFIISNESKSQVKLVTYLADFKYIIILFIKIQLQI